MTRARDSVEVLIVGAGIAGVSLSYFLSERGVTDVLVVEREAQAGCHATGRSAATLAELDPIHTIQKLKMIGAQFLRNPPPGFAQNPLLQRSGLLALYREPQWGLLRQMAPVFEQEGLCLRLLEPGEASEHVSSVLCESAFDGAALLPGDGFIDVHELLSSYMGHARRRGVKFRFGTEIVGVLTEGGSCRGVATRDGTVRARRVVNAAGAWVGKIAETTGALPIRLTPLRRSIVIFAAPDDTDVRGWPLVWSEPHSLYFRPETAGILFCPMDEAAMEPCDPGPDDTVIAEGLERLLTLAPKLVPRTLGQRWAGLRTFSPDRVPVVGEDPRLPGFFWLAGQGGCGIETSPALGQIAADLLTTGRTDRFDHSLLSPARFSAA